MVDADAIVVLEVAMLTDGVAGAETDEDEVYAVRKQLRCANVYGD